MITIQPYEILEVKPNATEKEVKLSYRKLAKKYHPDMPNGNANHFILIQNAKDQMLSFLKLGYTNNLLSLDELLKQAMRHSNYYKRSQAEKPLWDEYWNLRRNKKLTPLNKQQEYKKLLKKFEEWERQYNTRDDQIHRFIADDLLNASWKKYHFIRDLEDKRNIKEVYYKLLKELDQWDKKYSKWAYLHKERTKQLRGFIQERLEVLGTRLRRTHKNLYDYIPITAFKRERRG